MSTNPETRLQRKIQAALKERGAFVFKVHGSEYMMAGLPDLIVCYRGYYIGLEVKQPTAVSQVSRRQSYVHDQIRASGGIVKVVCSVEEALNILHEETCRQ